MDMDDLAMLHSDVIVLMSRLAHIQCVTIFIIPEILGYWFSIWTNSKLSQQMYSFTSNLIMHLKCKHVSWYDCLKISSHLCPVGTTWCD